jgi:DNA (cytosine-5)-methyltransferase 1
MPDLISLELCAGAGGQALGLEQAGVSHCALVELDEQARETLKANQGCSFGNPIKRLPS